MPSLPALPAPTASTRVTPPGAIHPSTEPFHAQPFRHRFGGGARPHTAKSIVFHSAHFCQGKSAQQQIIGLEEIYSSRPWPWLSVPPPPRYAQHHPFHGNAVNSSEIVIRAEILHCRLLLFQTAHAIMSSVRCEMH